MTLRPCLDCGVPTRGSRCPDCRRRYQRQYDATRPAADGVYSTAAWQRLRRRVLEEEAYTCHYCHRLASVADHVIPLRLRPDLGLERSNLVASCRSCNRRRVGRGETGFRGVAPAHRPHPSAAAKLSLPRFGPDDR